MTFLLPISDRRVNDGSKGFWPLVCFVQMNEWIGSGGPTMLTQQSSDTVEIAAPPTGRLPPVTSAASVRVDVAGLTHQGHVRPKNEDHFYICRFGRFLEGLETSLPDGAVPRRAEEGGYGLVVADGMGGMGGGEVASRLAITTLVNLALAAPDWILRLDDDATAEAALARGAEMTRQIKDVLVH